MADKKNPKQKKQPEIREGQENSSILHDKQGTADDPPYLQPGKQDNSYKQHEEYNNKIGSRRDEDDE